MIKQKTIGRYLYFYLCLGVVYSTYSFFLDNIFHPFGYNKKHLMYVGSLGGYLAAYLIFFYITMPIAVSYNIAVNLLPDRKEMRIAFGMIVGAITGAIFDIGSYYIGTYEKLKNIIVLTLVGLTIEVIRIFVVKKREQKKILHHENIISEG